MPPLPVAYMVLHLLLYGNQQLCGLPFWGTPDEGFHDSVMQPEFPLFRSRSCKTSIPKIGWEWRNGMREIRPGRQWGGSLQVCR